MDIFEIMRIQLSNNLKLLSTQEFIKRRKENVEINPDTFRRLTPKAFQLITYHLFYKLNAEECRKRFNGCFPVMERRQEGEFRQITNKWFQEITAKETTYQLPRVVPIYFQHFTPESIVCHLYLEFSNYILIKEFQRMSSGPQNPILMSEEEIDKTLTEYEITKANIKEETQEWTENMRYFSETFHKLSDSMNSLLQKRDQLLDSVRQKHDLSSDIDCPQFLESRSNSLMTSVTNLKTNIMAMNELVAKNWNNYLIAFESQNDYSNDMSIDFNQCFGRNELNSFSGAVQEFIRRVKRCDSELQNVSDKSLETLSNNSSKYSNELQKYRTFLKEMTSDMKSMLDQLRELTKKRRSQLLATPEIIERRKWFAERIPDISKLRFKLELTPRITKDKELDVVSKAYPSGGVSRDNERFDDSPVFSSLTSMGEFSFQVMNLSTCHYVAPTGCPLSMNDSHLFSPIENKTKSPFDSK